MANPEHLEILKQGAKAWNQWRKAEHVVHIDLTMAALSNVLLPGVNLSWANLSGANLQNAYLRGADMSHADISNADLNSANLGQANLYMANLSGALLPGVHFDGTNLIAANLEKACLIAADVIETNLSGANLSGADLSYAVLGAAFLFGATLNEADFNKAKIHGVTFNDCDLSKAKGLDSIIHYGPSSIGIDTIYRSNGYIPETFLRGCGVPDEFITYARSLVEAGRPIQFYSCFISYSSKNQLFAERLYADLQNKGVRCWLASEDLKIGEKIRIGIDESIRFHDKLLLVLTKYSVASDWVEQEVETALDRERKEKRAVLFPIRLDDTVMKIDTGWPALIKNTRNVGDFRKWRNLEAYQKAFDRLLRDLKADEKKP